MARFVKVSTTALSRCSRTLEDNLRGTCELVDKASIEKPDLIVLPEIFNLMCTGYKDIKKAAEDLNGISIKSMSEKALKYKCYITAPILIVRENKYYNSSVLIDRNGKVCNVYDKCFPTIEEIDSGTCPGQKPSVVNTDIGKLGFLICFDLNFAELREIYKKNGVELLIFSSMFTGGIQSQMWAFLNRCYLVSSVHHEEGSMIINPLGKIIGSSSLPYEPVLTMVVNLDFKVIHLYQNHTKIKDLKKEYGDNIKLEIGGAEGLGILSSQSEELSIDEMCREFDIKDIEEYLKDSKELRDRTEKKGFKRFNDIC